MTPIGCGEAVERLWDYLDGGLGSVDRRAVEEHLAFCLRCCGELEFARELRVILRNKGHAPMPPDVHDRLVGFLDRLDHASEQEPADGS